MKDLKTEHEIMRRQLWIDICRVVARAENCSDPSAPTGWANRAFKEFDLTFKTHQNTKNES